MLQRVGQVVEDAAGLFEARGRVLIHKAQRAGTAAAFSLVLGLAAAAGALTLVAAMVVALAEPLGVAGALAAGGALILALAGGGVMYLRHRGPDEEEEKLALQASLARDSLRKAFSSPEPQQQGGALDVKSMLQNFVKSPAGIAVSVGAVLAALLNARRVTRLGRVIALTGMASTLAGTVREIIQVVERVRASHARGNGAVRGERARVNRTPVATGSGRAK